MVSNETLIAILGTVVVLAGGYILYLYLRSRGQKIKITAYELRDGQKVRIHADKRLVGSQRRNVHTGVEEFYLPRILGRMPIEGIREDELILSDKGLPIVEILRKEDQVFVPIKQRVGIFTKDGKDGKKVFDRAEMQRSESDKEFIAWALHYQKKAAERHRTGTFWDKYGGYITLAVVALFCFMMVFFTVGKISDMTLDAQAQITGEARATNDLTRELIGKISGIESSKPAEGTDVPPGR